MMVLGGVAVSYERGTPVQEAARPKEGAKIALSLEEYKRRRNLA